MNIADPILFHCKRQAPVAAICAPGSQIGLISYRRLENAIHNISRRIASFGLPQRSIVAIDIEDEVFHLAVLLSLTKLGMSTLSITEADVPCPVRIDFLITTNARWSADLTKIILADWDWIEGDGRTLDTDQLPAVQANDPCRIVLMPVTSDKRNGIALTHRTIAQRLGYHCFFGKRSASCSRIYCDLPLTSEQGFRWIIYTLWRGGTVFLPGKTFEATLKSFEDYKTQCLVSSPDGLENLVKWFGAAPDYQTKIETIVCAEGMLTKSLSERVRTQMCSHLVSTYGMIETGVFAVANAQEIVDISGAVGFVTPNAVVKISNASGKLLPTGQEGFISIRSDVAAEYFDGRDDATGVFRDEWFQTTTVGALSSDNVLTLV